MPLVSRTRATFRSAEFGFFGVWVNTRTQTPRFCGLLCKAGLFVLLRTASRPLRTNWLIVGTGHPRRKTACLADATRASAREGGRAAPERRRHLRFRPRSRC